MNPSTSLKLDSEARLAGKTANPVRNYSILTFVKILGIAAAGGAFFFWWRKGHAAKTDDSIKRNKEKCDSETKLYDYKRSIDTKLEVVKAQLQTQLKSVECTNDILRTFAKECK